MFGSLSILLCIVVLAQTPTASAFAPHAGTASGMHVRSSPRNALKQLCNLGIRTELRMSSDDKSPSSGVIELADDEEDKPVAQKQSPAAPFLSQGEISEDALNPDLSDPKQTRVIIYIILSLVPVLFLVPLMLGSRDLIPLDSLPPVEM